VDDAREHRFHGDVVTVAVGGGGHVVLAWLGAVLGDEVPVDAVAGLAGEGRDELAPGAAVAFTERVEVVDLSVDAREGCGDARRRDAA